MLARFTPFDWLLAVTISLSAVQAFRRGLVRVLFSFAGLAAGLVAASWYYPAVAARLRPWVGEQAPGEILAFLAIVLAVAILFSLAGGLARRGVATVGLGLFDRVLGGLFGLLRGALAAVALLAALAAFAPATSLTRGSVLAPGLLAAARAVSFGVPAHLAEKISSGARHLLQQTRGQAAPARP